jgi:hypothetical protein
MSVTIDLFNRVRDALLENGFTQQDDYLLAHGASVISESSHEIIHVDTLRTILSASAEQADNWQQYAKEGETAQACIERHRAEQDALLKLYAAPTPAAAQTIGGSHESAGTQPVGTVAAASRTGQDKRDRSQGN